MPHPKNYLLQKIVDYKTNGMSSLGHLKADHIEDLTKVLISFGEEIALDVIDRLNKGEKIVIRDKIMSL